MHDDLSTTESAPPAPATPPPPAATGRRYFKVLRRCEAPIGPHRMHVVLPEGEVLNAASYDIEALKALGVPLEEVSGPDSQQRAILR